MYFKCTSNEVKLHVSTNTHGNIKACPKWVKYIIRLKVHRHKTYKKYTEHCILFYVRIQQNIAFNFTRIFVQLLQDFVATLVFIKEINM